MGKNLFMRITILIILLFFAIPGVWAASGTPVWSTNFGYSINWLSASSNGNVIITGTFAYTGNGSFTNFCLDNSGNVKWKSAVTNAVIYEGVNWTGISADGAFAATGGWISSSSHTGFIQAFVTSTGKQILNDRTQYRVQGIAFSDDGSWLACAADNLRLYKLLSFWKIVWIKIKIGSFYIPRPTFIRNYYYSLTNTLSIDNEQLHTVSISSNGQWIAIGGNNTSPSNCTVRLVENQQGILHLTQTWKTNLQLYTQFIDMTPDGNWFTSAIRKGNIQLFNLSNFISTGKPLWNYAVNNSQQYVLAAKVSRDGLKVLVDSNLLQNGHYGVCMLSNVQSSGTYSPQVLWYFNTIRQPNPGLGMDASARFAVVADGYPVNTAGHYYLINAVTGALIWSYTNANNMAWPITISCDGKNITAGNDNGMLYHWTN